MAEPVRNYPKLALQILEKVGGEKNIVSATRCATRLRLVLRETPAGAKETVGELRRGSRRSVARRDWKRGRSLAVRLLRVEGMGHAWSGGAAGQAFSDPSGPDAPQTPAPGATSPSTTAPSGANAPKA